MSENRQRDQKPTMNKRTLQTAKRLLRYVTRDYKAQFIFVCVCILMSSIASISVSLSLKVLLDDYIVPADRTPESGLFRSSTGR